VTLAVVMLVMQIAQIDLHRISLGALIIALALLVDDAMTTVDATLRRLAAGDRIETAAGFAYRTLAAPMLTLELAARPKTSRKKIATETQNTGFFSW
jgi:multidrug efflux pump subunit AcrB